MSVRVTLITIISSNALNSIAVTRQMKPPGNNSTKSSYVFSQLCITNVTPRCPRFPRFVEI